jgi:uncharacterized Zn-binding protein involved in type VI secretion
MSRALDIVGNSTRLRSVLSSVPGIIRDGETLSNPSTNQHNTNHNAESSAAAQELTIGGTVRAQLLLCTNAAQVDCVITEGSPTGAIGRATVLTANPAETEVANSLSHNPPEEEAVDIAMGDHLTWKELSKHQCTFRTLGA